jgi:pimeloyl-ACP methyl ester carboxylesterase
MTAEARADGPPNRGGPGRAARRLILLGAGVTAGVAATALARRAALKRARAAPDPEAGEPLDEVPGPERRLSLPDGTELAVYAAGPPGAPTIVFLHGFTQDVTSWHYQWKHFSRRYRCLVYDQRGHGRSGPSPSGDYSLEALAQDLKRVLDRECADSPVALVGHSLGGMVLLAFAEQYPEEFGGRIRAVVLASTAAGQVLKELLGGLVARVGGMMIPLPRVLGRNVRMVGALRQRAFAGRGDLAWLVARTTNFGPDAPASLVDHVVGVAARTPGDIWADVVRSILEMDLAHTIGHVTVPALVIVGDGDRLTPQTSARIIEAGLPRGQIAVVERAGHLAMMERHDEWNRVVEAFLEEAWGDVGGAPANAARRRRRGKVS